jgi:ParB-like chromosome segregation protein Spo0J
MIDHDIRFIPITQIEENEFNPNSMDGKAFERLLKEIQTSGFIAAIQVVPLDNGKFRIIGGAHRYKAALKLGFHELPCVVLADAQFKSEDVQKFLTVKLNMLSGELDPDKFRILYEEMAEKYGEESLQDLFGFTDETEWDAVTKAIKRELKDNGFTEEQIDKAWEEAGEDKSIENLSRILNGIFSENGETLNSRGYMIFDFEGSKMFFMDVDKKVFKFFDEMQINEDPAQLNGKLLEVLQKAAGNS